MEEQSAALAHLGVENLSTREMQVFLGLAKGLTVSEISRTYFLSVKTVSTYRGRILEKTGTRNNVEISHLAAALGLIPARVIYPDHSIPRVLKIPMSSIVSFEGIPVKLMQGVVVQIPGENYEAFKLALEKV